MHEVKDTKRASVRVGYDGRVHKRYFGPGCEKRFENEVRILKYLESKGCNFVPKILQVDEENLYMVTTNCGHVVDQLSEEKQTMLFRSLEQYGVRHGDPFMRNITYNAREGKFCIIDFEFATNLETGEGLAIEDIKNPRQLD
jgi:tRNA A-37 threonylcarbamoyl transferase component Bud32